MILTHTMSPSFSCRGAVGLGAASPASAPWLGSGMFADVERTAGRRAASGVRALLFVLEQLVDEGACIFPETAQERGVILEEICCMRIRTNINNGLLMLHARHNHNMHMGFSVR